MNKKVLVTGASRGIGRAIAKKFLENGDIVYGTYNNSFKEIKELEEKYGKENLEICGPFNFSKIDEINKFVDSILNIKFDTVVLNAGMFSDNDDFINFNLDIFNEVMNCNFYAPLIIGTRLRENINEGGNIVIMSSNDAYSGSYSSMSYGISKGALFSLMKSLAVNYGRKHIRVNSVAPGAINTDMNTIEQEFEAPIWTPINRIAEPYEVANVVYFLSSNESSFINAENITIDGGYSQTSILLKKEMERARIEVSYQYLIDLVKESKKGEKLYLMDTTLDYCWNDYDEEDEFIAEVNKAMARGVIVKRIIIISKGKEKILESKSVIDNINSCNKESSIMTTIEDDLKKKNIKEYRKIGKGYMLYLGSEKNVLYIDSFKDANSVGFVIDNDMVMEQLKENFENVSNLINKK